MKIIPKHFSDAHRSIFQSAVREVELEINRGVTADSLDGKIRGLFAHHEKQGATATLLENEQKVTKESTIETCAKLAWQLVKAKIKEDKEEIEYIENQLKFSPCDAVGWAKVIEIYFEYYHFGKEPMYRTYEANKIDSSFVYPIPEGDLTVGVIGDWGTGEEVASVVLEEVFSHEPDILIHVGDIYYAGTKKEAQANFLDVINEARQKPSEGKSRNIPVYNLPGNHDYYSGGAGFYYTVDSLNTSPYVPEGTPKQEASFFCLRNSSWQLQGMDTGFHDHDVFKVSKDTTHLHDSEIVWHQDKLASAGERKVILFSHHQLFSSFLAINGGTHNQALYEPFEESIVKGQTVAWLWGHEHLLEIYAPYMGLKAGRCIGNGAFPELISQSPYKLLEESEVGEIPPLLTNPETGEIFKTGTTGQVVNHGYVILKLSDGSALASYFQVPGDGSSQSSTLVFEESL